MSAEQSHDPDGRAPLGRQRGEQIGFLPLSALCGQSSKSAEEAKARQIRHELAMSGEERVELAFRLGERRYSP